MPGTARAAQHALTIFPYALFGFNDSVVVITIPFDSIKNGLPVSPVAHCELYVFFLQAAALRRLCWV